MLSYEGKQGRVTKHSNVLVSEINRFDVLFFRWRWRKVSSVNTIMYIWKYNFSFKYRFGQPRNKKNETLIRQKSPKRSVDFQNILFRIKMVANFNNSEKSTIAKFRILIPAPITLKGKRIDKWCLLLLYAATLICVSIFHVGRFRKSKTVGVTTNVTVSIPLIKFEWLNQPQI